MREPWSVDRVLEPAPTVERAPDGDWMVRHVRPANAVKHYVCPGCGRTIPPGTAHLVVWQQDSLLGSRTAFEDRRHWHDRCWRTRRSSNAESDASTTLLTTTRPNPTP